MHPLIEQNREAIAALCRKHHVKRLDVFGSATTGAFDPERSDVDFLVEFEDDFVEGRFRAYFSLLEDLKALLGRDVDLVEPGGVRNRFYWIGIDQTRQRLYAA